MSILGMEEKKLVLREIPPAEPNQSLVIIRPNKPWSIRGAGNWQWLINF